MVGFGVFDFLFIIDTIMESSLSSGWKHCLFVCSGQWCELRVDPWTGPGLHIEVNALLTQDIILKVATVIGLRKCLDSIIASLLVSSTSKWLLFGFRPITFDLLSAREVLGHGIVALSGNVLLTNIYQTLLLSRVRERENVPCFQIFWANITLESIFLIQFQRAFHNTAL